MIARLTPPLLLASLALLLFADLVRQPGGVLYSDYSDLLGEHLPAKRFAARAYQETGELPLWCPYGFAGAPLLHDPQVGLFYPPHWPLLLLPQPAVGPALSWLVALHLLVAGWGACAYARARGLGAAAALAAGCGYMLAGKWALHLLLAGHYITVGLAWLPWALLLLEGALRRRSLARATGAGLALGLLVLGTHPQWAFYAGLFLALWTLGAALEEAGWLGSGPRSGRRLAGALAGWAGYGAWAAALAAALAAVQLLPTLDAAALSTRAGGVASGDILQGGLRALVSFIGPPLQTKASCLMWEDRGGFGLLWVVAAVLAPFLCRGRVRFEAGVCLGLVLFALGGAVLFQGLPGFRFFRQPSRMLLIATLPVALLAAETTQALFAGAGLTPQTRALCRRLLVRLAGAAALLTGGVAVALALRGEVPHLHAYWLTLLVTVPAAYWLLGTPDAALRGRVGQLLWGLILLLDLWALARPLAGVRAESAIYEPPACVTLLERASREGRRVLDRDPFWDEGGTPLGFGAPLAMIDGLESLRGYNPLDYRRYKEYLQFIAGRDDPMGPLDGAHIFPVVGNFPIKNKSLLDLLGTGYALQPTALAGLDEWRLEGAGWRAIGEDAAPSGYDSAAGGRRPVPPYTVYENTEDLPRAFIVPEARPLPERSRVLETLAATDFRARVLLEDWDGPARPGGDAAFRAAEIVEYRPNRVMVRTEPGLAGYLVLADVWYPGWRCTVDGREVPLYRANYLFRAVELPEGAHEVVFTFEPDSYRRGRAVSLAALGVALLVVAVSALRRRRPHPSCC